MPDLLHKLTKLIKKIIGCYPRLPQAQIIRQLLEIAYLTTLKTDKGRFILALKSRIRLHGSLLGKPLYSIF
jgi:hypothetical protein